MPGPSGPNLGQIAFIMEQFIAGPLTARPDGHSLFGLSVGSEDYNIYTGPIRSAEQARVAGLKYIHTAHEDVAEVN